MKISTKGRYALKIGLEMTRHHVSNPDELIDLKTIAKNQKLSIKYLEHIMTLLRRKGIVQSVRGVKGGYRLARPPAQITLLEVLEASERITDFCPCFSRKTECPFAKACAMCDIWGGMRDALVKHLSSFTLRDAHISHLKKLRKAAKG
jgi:Rrf2 family protein